MIQKRVLAFGTFDPLHAGHRHLFREARGLGGHLTVVVARDEEILKEKHRSPFLPEHVRLAAVASDRYVDEAMLGDEDPQSYALLRDTPFDILALGYDQSPDDEQVKDILRTCGKGDVPMVRLSPYMPHLHKSSFLRSA